MLLYVIRHGDPCYDPDSLTPLGQRQAEAVGRRLAQVGITRVYSSPLVRAQQTAQPLCELLRLQPTIEDWTSESHAWKHFTQTYNGRQNWTFWQPNTKLRSPQNRKLDDQHFDQCDCYADLNLKQAYQYLIQGSDDFLKRHGYQREDGVYRILQPNDERIALFCHEGFSMHWFPFLLAIPPHLFWASFAITHTGVSVFQFENTDDGYTAPRALCIDDTSHLLAEHLPNSFQRKFLY